MDHDDSVFLTRVARPGPLVGLGVVLLALDSIGVLGDRTVATLLAILVAVGAAGAVLRLSRPDRGAARVAIVTLAVATVGACLAPVIATLLPGRPLLHAEVSEGARLELPEGTEGHVRLLVHAHIAGDGAGGVDYRIAGLQPVVSGHLARTTGTARIGRRRVQDAHVNDEQFTSAVLAPAAGCEASSHPALVVELARGALDGPLEVALYREVWPLQNQIVLGLFVVAGLALAAMRRWIEPAAMAVCGWAIAFGMLAYRWVSPDTPLRPEIGALIVAAGVATAGYVGWRWIVERSERVRPVR
jgi:hypothetical protein